MFLPVRGFARANLWNREPLDRCPQVLAHHVREKPAKLAQLPLKSQPIAHNS